MIETFKKLNIGAIREKIHESTKPATIFGYFIVIWPALKEKKLKTYKLRFCRILRFIGKLGKIEFRSYSSFETEKYLLSLVTINCSRGIGMHSKTLRVIQVRVRIHGARVMQFARRPCLVRRQVPT